MLMTVEHGADAAARFDAFVVPELEVLYRVARSLSGTDADAEDLVQETVLRAYRAIDRFDGRHPRAWLLTIMRNANINRARRRRPELLDDPDLTFETTEAPHGTDGRPEDLVVEPVFDAVVEAAYRALPEPFRQVVDLVDLDGLHYQEAADLLGIPVGTVMSRLHRARKRIRDQLVRNGITARGGRA
jgi:RNA polymerase sigma-70 factor, ECF subfamily